MKPTRERAIAALRAVLDLCDETPLRYRPYDGADPYMVIGVPVLRQTITDALAAEPGGAP